MNISHRSTNSPASSVGNFQTYIPSQLANNDGYGNPDVAGIAPQQQPQPPHQLYYMATGNPSMLMQNPGYLPYSGQVSPYVARMANQGMMNTQAPPQHLIQAQQQQQPVHHMQPHMQQAPQSQAHLTRFPSMPQYQQTGYGPQEPVRYSQMPSEGSYTVSGMPAQYYQPLPVASQPVPSRQDGMVAASRAQLYPGAQMIPAAQWQMYQQGQSFPFQQQVPQPARFTQPVARQMQVQPRMHPDMIPEATVRAASIEEQPSRPTYGPRMSAVYFDVGKSGEGEEKSSYKKAPSRAIPIIDPNNGKNVLETIESGTRYQTDKALQIQSEFANKVTQRIAQEGRPLVEMESSDVHSLQLNSRSLLKPDNMLVPIISMEAAKQEFEDDAEELQLEDNVPEVSQVVLESEEVSSCQAEPVVQMMQVDDNVKVEQTLSCNSSVFVPASFPVFVPASFPVFVPASFPVETEASQETSFTPLDLAEEQPAAETTVIADDEQVEDVTGEINEDDETVTDTETVGDMDDSLLPGANLEAAQELQNEPAQAESISEDNVVTENEVVMKPDDDAIRTDLPSGPLPVDEPSLENVAEPAELEPEEGEIEDDICEVDICEVDMDTKKNKPDLTSDEIEVKTEQLDTDTNSELEDGEIVDTDTEADKDDKPNYNYEPGQWSPFNPDGIKVYGRDFLLQLQYAPESKKMPPGLPHVPDIIRNSLPSMEMTREDSFSSNAPAYAEYNTFAPAYFVDRSNSRRNVPVKRNSYQKRNEPVGKVITLALQEDVRLHKTDQAWKPAVYCKDEKSDAEELKTQKLYKQMRGILNKLTPQAFEKLVGQVLEMPIDNENRLSGVINIMFEKVISEPNFSESYASMANRMTVLSVPRSDISQEKVSFRKLLLNRCQSEFEKDKLDEQDIERREKEIEAATSEEKKKTLIAEKEIAMTKSRRRSLGNIRFIGELFKLKMLTEKIMHECVTKLLKSNDEESLELLCRLLTTIGKEMDTEKSKRLMDSYFNQIQKKSELKSVLSNRIRFMLQELCELRKSKWVPRRNENKPKTIEEIHKEAHKEKEMKQQMLNTAPLPPKPRQDRRAGMGSSSVEKVSDDGWTTAGGGSSSKNRIDASRMMKIAKNMKEDVQLMPPTFMPSWQKGSSGMGSRGSSQEAEKPSNRFSALENVEPQGGYPGDDRNRFRFLPGSGAGAAGSRNFSHTLPRQKFTDPAGRVSSSSSQDRSRNASLELNQGRDYIRGATLGRSSPLTLPTVDREMPKEPTSRPAVAAVELSRSDMERKTIGILDEYLSEKNIKEAVACVEELKSPKSMHMFVACAINHVLEKRDAARSMVGSLLHELLRTELISLEQFENGLKEVLEDADSLAVDIPKVWQYLGEILGTSIRDDHRLWQLLKAGCQDLVTKGKDEIFFRETIHSVYEKLGAERTCKALRMSGLRWSDYVKEHLFPYVRTHKLENLDPVREELIALLQQHSVNEPLFIWIEDNIIPVNERESREFIRALVTAVCTCALVVTENPNGQTASYSVTEERIVSRQALLQKYLDHTAHRELQALYAVQGLIHSLEHPPNILNAFFDALYDKDIISEEAFYEWKNSTDPAEQTGKGVACASVKAFFQWLQEGTEEATGS